TSKNDTALRGGAIPAVEGSGSAQRRCCKSPGIPGVAARFRLPTPGEATHPARGESARAAYGVARGRHQLRMDRGGRGRAGSAAAARPALGELKRTLAAHRGGGGGPSLFRRLSTDPGVRRGRLLAAVSGPDEGPRPPVVQHGGVRQPGEGSGAPGKEGQELA